MHKATKSNHESLVGRYWKWLLIIFGIIFLMSICGYFIIIYGGSLVVDDEDLILEETTTIETEDGTVLKKIYNEHRTSVDIEEVPEHVQDAFVAIEDRRFYNHSGVDFKSVSRAVYRDLLSMKKVQGASTITQQLAKNISLENDKTWLRKTKEVMAAIYLERHFSKKKILELYMNQMYFGHGVYGVEEASQLFFSKPVSELTVSEGALLAGLAKSPTIYSPIDHPDKALERRNVVLDAMSGMKAISTDTRLKEQGKTLGLNIQEEETTTEMDSYIDMVMKEAADKHQLPIRELQRGGYRIVANVDETAQKASYQSFQDDDYFPGNTDGVEGAFVMMDHETGRVVAVQGGRNYALGDLNRATIKRQPGSALKPVAVYGPAFMTDDFQPYSMIPDQEMDIDGYSVRNVDGEYADAVSIYEAVQDSKNAPAVWLLHAIGIDNGKTYMDEMGLTIPDKGLAIALGGLEEGLTPFDMAKAYSSFANMGKAVEPHTIQKIYDRDNEVIAKGSTDTSDIFNPQVAWDMTKILSNVVENGTAQAGDYSKALAGKTGTTEHPYVDGQAKDAWFVGYTPQYVTTLWMGYDQTDKDHYLTEGSSYPTALTKHILTAIDEDESLLADFDKPSYVDDLPDPIELPEVTNVEASYTFGGFSIVKGKITWDAAEDDRVVYHVYEKKQGIDERVGEVEGENEFVIDDVSIFSSKLYYVVPYNPLTKMEGKASETVEVSW